MYKHLKEALAHSLRSVVDLRIDLVDAALPHWVAPAAHPAAANDEAGIRAA